MPVIFIIYGGLATVLLFLTISKMNKYRRLYYRCRHKDLNYPIPLLSLPQIDPIFKTGKHGFNVEATVQFIAASDETIGATSDQEAWVLAVLAKKAQNMFEFGTASGRTTYLWACNSPENARITTLTLHPQQQALYQKGSEDDSDASQSALNESVYADFMYTATPVESKITQLFGDSKAFDESPFLNRCDLIFVDGSHSYSYVKSDTEKAFRMLAPGGIIIWHDYRDDTKHTLGVYKYLNEISKKYRLRRIPKTTMVIYRKEKGE